MSLQNSTPSERPRFRMPAEWGPHAATWLSWPHNEETWPGVFAGVEPAFCRIVEALAPHETVRINVLGDDHRRHVERLLRPRVPAGSVVCDIVPTNDAWIRDHGAIFVLDERGAPDLVALDFVYNAWGGKYPPFDLDAKVARRMAELLGAPITSIPMVLEGGSIEVDGTGLLLTTEQCLLNANRNPHMSRIEIEQRLGALLGTTDVLWLGSGIDGDDTDGHVDDVTRFVGPARVVTALESNRGDPNHAPLAANRRRLDELVTRAGRRLEVLELPMPPPLFNRRQRLPASYANFYVANEIVLMPAFACAQDETALAILAECFSGREVVAIDCRALVAGLGGVHCLTQQVPAIVGAAGIS